MTCNCPPAMNIFCLENSLGMTVSQPQCQELPDSSRVDNPFYDSGNNLSFYSYEVIFNCGNFPGGNPGNLLTFDIAICQNIPLPSILDVRMLLNTCPEFIPVQYGLVDDQSSPAGYQFLRIAVNQAIIPGSSAVFRIILSGNYPGESPSDGAVFVLSSTISQFPVPSQGSFLVAACPAIPRLTVSKSCDNVIVDNRVTLNYSVVVANTGDVDLDNVIYTDVLNYDGPNVNLGQIDIAPGNITVNTSTPGIVSFDGDLGTITTGNSVTVTYTIPILAFISPNTYVFSNMADARSGATEGVSECMQTVEVVELSTENCCLSDIREGSFVFSVVNLPNSPATAIDITGSIIIPSGLIVQFTNFGTCDVTFPSGMPVPLDTDLTNVTLNISCESSLTPNSTVSHPFQFVIVSINNFTGNVNTIASSLSLVLIQDPSSQVLLNVSPLPNNQNIDVDSILQCQSTV